jgi:hypothetical protein
VITCGLEVPVIGASLLLAIHRDLRAVHIQHDAPRRIDSFGPGD